MINLCLCEYKCITNIKIIRIFIVQKFYSKIEFNVCLYIKKKKLKNRTLQFSFHYLFQVFELKDIFLKSIIKYVKFKKSMAI